MDPPSIVILSKFRDIDGSHKLMTFLRSPADKYNTGPQASNVKQITTDTIT